jgi:hypothetical protein
MTLSFLKRGMIDMHLRQSDHALGSSAMLAQKPAPMGKGMNPQREDRFGCF